MTLYLSRLRLDRGAGNAALQGLLDPTEAGRAMDAHHRLIWTLFADGAERRRDFLWRSEGQGRFLVLSERPPVPHPLFETPEVKEFAPVLASGDRLGVVLRANATRQKRSGERVDVVMDAIHALPEGARAPERMEAASREGRAWLERQGEKAGFRVLSALAEDYSTEGPSGPRKGQPRFGILDLSGRIEVTDPDAFVAQLGRGFGRAKAFGCGLMLIRRTT
ncbi:type I-E CRISPR-associated protein Cas6/Cse3/CasE [Defluviimonas sp. SAOS-178_SWC]|uniref:type I-E CRISPR-associated protein Cas6/Cse3/CasE n=1 Tax=Defluviimonas sp. SAOS-178_SWC TaxID=3121287 RepID=UPI0032220CB7